MCERHKKLASWHSFSTEQMMRTKCLQHLLLRFSMSNKSKVSNQSISTKKNSTLKLAGCDILRTHFESYRRQSSQSLEEVSGGMEHAFVYFVDCPMTSNTREGTKTSNLNLRSLSPPLFTERGQWLAKITPMNLQKRFKRPDKQSGRKLTEKKEKSQSRHLSG
jgi:hypothetical protein